MSISKDEHNMYHGLCAIGELGSMISIVLSYSINQSIGWCILHGLIGWFYVIYFAIVN